MTSHQMNLGYAQTTFQSVDYGMFTENSSENAWTVILGCRFYQIAHAKHECTYGWLIRLHGMPTLDTTIVRSSRQIILATF